MSPNCEAYSFHSADLFPPRVARFFPCTDRKAVHCAVSFVRSYVRSATLDSDHPLDVQDDNHQHDQQACQDDEIEDAIYSLLLARCHLINPSLYLVAKSMCSVSPFTMASNAARFRSTASEKRNRRSTAGFTLPLRIGCLSESKCASSIRQ